MPEDAKVVNEFIARWERSGASERANYQLFLSELCDVLGVPRPEPSTSDDSQNAYVFERAVCFEATAGDSAASSGRIDLYKRGCFVLEAKQGAEKPATATPLSDAGRKARAGLKKGTAQRGTQAWDDAMLRARGQADQYVRALPPSEGRPPFLVVVDVGHSIELYSEFSCTGGTYVPFPDPVNHRIFLRHLERPDVRQRLQMVWTDPHGLDPSRRSARVTREIAEKLAQLANSLEGAGHEPHAVASFLMRCLFTMFAEDVWLLGKNSFRNLLESLRDTPEHFVPMVEELWEKMNTGGFSTSLRLDIVQFNGGIFADSAALPLTRDQLLLLIEAAACDWRDVEPAIFGTLLERALNPVERHKLGAHYTPRAYVERLVLHTVMEPLRQEWTAVQAAAVQLANQGKTRAAVTELRSFHKSLCGLRILDPACGSVNFLYVAFEHLKRLEGEVFNTLEAMGERQLPLEMPGECVFPNQFLGIEVNPRAAAIAELVLWIGALQWHYRTRGSVRPPQPIIRNFHNIECRDAVLVWDATEPVLNPAGQPVTRWDGHTTKPHAVTGLEVPDEAARAPVLRYLNAGPAVWPDADFIIGNPPFIGNKRMRDNLGDGYVEALRSAHPEIAGSSDFVMYWWEQAAELVRTGKVRRFGFVCTKSLTQDFNRRVLERHLDAESPLSLAYAIPNHPWVDSADGAAVRIAMAVGVPGKRPGLLQTVSDEKPDTEGGYVVNFASRTGPIHADLTIGADVSTISLLAANRDLSFMGCTPVGAGFLVTESQARHLGLGTCPGAEVHIRPFVNGKDLTDRPRCVWALDFFGMTCDEVRRAFPDAYQWIVDRVKPEREQNNDPGPRQRWWVFARPREDMRAAISRLSRYIATCRTAKHRVFQFLDASVLPDSKVVATASADAFILGVLSSAVHLVWALRVGSRHGIGNDPNYNNTVCFGAFPFPAASAAQQPRIRDLAEQLDAHRKRQQALHPGLTLTGMYNVLEKLRAIDAAAPPSRRSASASRARVAEPATLARDASPEGSGESGRPGGGSGAAPPPPTPSLTAKERQIHDQGLVSVLKQLHDELDQAVFDAYGWPSTLSNEEILERLVALNRERAAEEERGLVRWLRPEYQCPGAATATTPTQSALDLTVPAAPASGTSGKNRGQAWPRRLSDRMQVVRAALSDSAGPLTAADIAARFGRVSAADVADLLDTLADLGHVTRLDGGRFVRA